MTARGDIDHRRAIATFERNVRSARSLAELADHLSAVLADVRFGYFALLHNVDLARRHRGALMLTTYPAAWTDEFIATRLFLDDPVHAASAKAPGGVRWDRLGDYIVPSARQVSTLAKASAHGLATGFTLVMPVLHEADAIFSVARSADVAVTCGEARAARLIGRIALERGRALLGESRLTWEPVSLSPRQIDCIALVAPGKSDWEIAQILGLSRDTVHEYIETARKRYGVRRRTQLVLRAVRDGHFSIDTVL